MKDVLAELALKVTPYTPAMSSLTLRGDEGGLREGIKIGPIEMPEKPRF